MNMISELRRRVRQSGAATITAAEYDRLQQEWITRAGAEEMVSAEREDCAVMLEMKPSELKLMAGEMTAQEVRTVMAVLSAIQAKIRSTTDNRKVHS